jgi:hypothetical protein
MKTRKWMSWLFCFAVTFAFAAPAFAWPIGGLNDSEEPGSVIVFHKFIRGFSVNNEPNTRFEISVVCPTPGTCREGDFNTGQVVNLRAHWVCPGVPADQTSVCQETDFNLTTTVNGTLNFDAGGNGAPLPPCDRGYLIAWVIDPDRGGIPIKFDGLIGDAVISESLTSSRAYNALPIQASESLVTNDPTDVNGNGALDFDGCEYKAITGTIYGSVRYPDSTTETDLTLLTLDVHSNLPNDTTFVSLNFYDESETLRSTATNFKCWAEQRLEDIDPALFGFGIKGLVKSTAAIQTSGPVTLVGIVETKETVRLPVSLTAPAQPVTVAVTFPTCLPAESADGCTLTPSRDCAFPRLCVLLGTCTTSLVCNATAPAQVVSALIPVIRDNAYSLYNDSIAVLTTFFPF